MADGDLQHFGDQLSKIKKSSPKMRPSRGLRARPKFDEDIEVSAIPDDFIEELYLALNPDAADAIATGLFPSAFAHWLAIGARETADGKRPLLKAETYYDNQAAKRVVCATEARYLDTQSYLYLNPDVRDGIGVDAELARAHWTEHGRFEQRRAPGIAPFRKRRVEFALLDRRIFGFNIFGPFMAQTGLGTACRNMLAAFKQTKLPFDVWNLDTRHGPARMTTADKQRLPRFRINIIFANADQIETVFNEVPEGFFNHAYNIAVWQWELAAFRPDWFTAFGAIDEVWTNSRFQAAAIRASAPVPVTYIALPVLTPKQFTFLSRANYGVSDQSFLFLLVFDVGSTIERKNPFAGIRAFKSAFDKNNDVHLLIKYQTPEHDEAFSLQLSKILAGAGNIHVIAETLTQEQMACLRMMADCLIAPHRSEGFGLNIAEFMALAKPVIATNYSGNVDFLNETNGYPVPYRLVEIEKPAGPYPLGYIWAEPDENALAAAMRAVVQNPGEAARRSQQAAAFISQNFSAGRIAWDIISRIRKTELDQKLPEFTKWIGRSSGLRAPSPLRTNDDEAMRPLPALNATPLISVLVPVYNVPPEYLEICIQSVLQQTYPFWELCIANDGCTRPDTMALLARYRGLSPRIKIHDAFRNNGIAIATNSAASMAVGEYLAFLDHDDLLHIDALMEVATAINANPAVDCLYTDEIKINELGYEIDHFYKPDFSPEHLESVMYVLHLLVIRKRLFLNLGRLRPAFDGAQDYDLMLRISRVTDQIVHIPKALYAWRAITGSAALTVDAKPEALEAGKRALEDHVLQKYGQAARADRGRLTGTFRVHRAIPAGLPVTLIILTNNQYADVPGRGKINLLHNFIRSIREKTTYPHYQIMVLDNASLRKSQVNELSSDGVTVLDYGQHSAFNFAAKANFAVRAARTEMLVLLNDDMEVINSGWLHALLEFAADPDIGAVGARLLRADDTVQHVGAVVGVNNGVGHVYHNAPHDFIGYNGFTHIIRNFSAVTGACMATRKTVLLNAGGFDESFAVEYNDIDLCLKLRRAGYRIVYTPYAELYHFERQSIRHTTINTDERDRFVERWKHVYDDDPYYNVNLTRNGLDFSRAC